MGKFDKVSMRQAALKELIRTQAIENQATLVQLLKERYGIESTQSIVSRDLHELEVSKRKYKDTLIYELKDIDASREILHLGVKDVVCNESLIVVKTLPGLAAFVGDYLDFKNDERILATLAGENVVFVAPARVRDIEKIYELICELLYFKQTEE